MGWCKSLEMVRRTVLCLTNLDASEVESLTFLKGRQQFMARLYIHFQVAGKLIFPACPSSVICHIRASCFPVWYTRHEFQNQLFFRSCLVMLPSFTAITRYTSIVSVYQSANNGLSNNIHAPHSNLTGQCGSCCPYCVAFQLPHFSVPIVTAELS